MKFNLALIGFGTVGQGLIEILMNKQDFLKKEYDSFSCSIPFREDQGQADTDSKVEPAISVTQRLYLDSTKTDTERRILLAMDRPKTVEEIAAEIGYDDISLISNDLLDLEKEGAIVCLTPDRDVHQQYYLTGPGARVRSVLMGEERFEDLA